MRFVRSYWGEDDIDFFLEIDDEGWVQRHVEVVRSSGEVLGAASLAEWSRARDEGSIPEYQRRFGVVAEGNVSTWVQGWPHEEISADEYEAVWRGARSRLEGPGES